MAKLIKPTVELEREFNDYINEWKEYNEKIVPTVLRKAGNDFEAFVQRLLNASQGIGVREGWVPDSTYFLVDRHNRIMGASNIRHRLTEPLLNIGGHVGYGVRPTERGKGYATEILKQSLMKIKEMGIDQALITCNEDNIASKKVILNNGGVQDESFTEEDGTVVNRFWVDLTKA